MARQDPLRPLRWSHNENGNGVYTYECRCGWLLKAIRFSLHHYELIDPNYGFRPNYLELQDTARRLKQDHEPECPERKKNNG